MLEVTTLPRMTHTVLEKYKYKGKVLIHIISILIQIINILIKYLLGIEMADLGISLYAFFWHH